MKLSFNVTLDVSVPESYDLADDDIKAYCEVLENAVEHQVGFGGLTPDYLSNEDVGVNGFYVGADPRLTQAANGEAFALWWMLEDIQDHAANLDKTLNLEEARTLLRRLEHDVDASTGVSWTEVAAAIDFILGH